MTAFRIVVIFVLGGILGLIAAHLRFKAGSWKSGGESLARYFRRFPEVRSAGPVSGGGTSLRQVRGLVYRAALLLSLVLALTGFAPVIIRGEHLTGVLLLIHVTIAPFFAVLLASAALLWADHQRLDERHFILLRNLITGQFPEPGAFVGFIVRGGFWLLLMLSLPLLFSIILGMFPVFGTEGEGVLISLHGYSALCVAAVVLVHTYALMIQRDFVIGKRTEEERQ